MKTTEVGLDLGNRRTKVCINGLCASIPSQHSFDKPVILRNGQERKVSAFALLFRIAKDKDIRLWFGDDTLASKEIITELDQTKYSKLHIQRMFQAVLYEWSRKHNTPLSGLGKLSICVSMPPGSYQKPKLRKAAESAYRKAFNTGQSHIQLRDGKESVQIVTQFHSLVREAVVWGSDIPRRGELVLTIDLGGGTDDVVLFNGSAEPIDSYSNNNGLIRVYSKINPANPALAELNILRDKSYTPTALMAYFSEKKMLVQSSLRTLPERREKKVYIIGGGAEMIARQPEVKKEFTNLLPAKKLIIKGQYANAEANWKEASK